MRLCFLGDISVERAGKITGPRLGINDAVIANLEGPLVSDEDLAIVRPANIAIYNTHIAIEVLQTFGVTGVCLANNHIYDLPLPAAYTQTELNKHAISSFGAGISLTEANRPLVLTSGKTTVQVFGFGWQVIGCQTTNGLREGVNPLEPQHMLSTIRKLRQSDTASYVIYMVHWNYELERYPQPAHRQLAHDLIRAGVDAVIGLHPHVVQGAESVDGKPVVYSLGNWFFPPRTIGQFSLRFPKICNRQLAFELNISARQVQGYVFHWYQFDPDSCILTLETTETDLFQPLISKLTPYAGMPHEDYQQWFIKNRNRRRGLPIYADYRHTVRNYLKDRYVLMRQSIIRRAIKLGLKRGLSS